MASGFSVGVCEEYYMRSLALRHSATDDLMATMNMAFMQNTLGMLDNTWEELASHYLLYCICKGLTFRDISPIFLCYMCSILSNKS
jgi:hypothetical protein